MENKNLEIQTIFCQPRSIERYQYKINDLQMHSLTKEKLILFLKDVIPEKLSEIHKLIEDNLAFLIIIETKEIKHLKFDYNKEIDKIKKETAKTSFRLQHQEELIYSDEEFKKAKAKKQEFSLDNYMNFDKEFDKFSKLTGFEKKT